MIEKVTEELKRDVKKELTLFRVEGEKKSQDVKDRLKTIER